MNILKKIRLLSVLSAFIAPSAIFANAVVISASSFANVQKIIQQVAHPHHTLLVSDDDDTLTMMPCGSNGQCQYVGDPAWFAWQSGLSANNTQRIWSTYPELLKISNFLFAISKMPLDDNAIPGALSEATKRGVKVIVETARSYDTTNATERQFTEDNILSVIENDALKTNHGNISFAGPYLPDTWNANPVRAVAYTDGVFYVAGQNKGVMLAQLLKKAKKTKDISEIIFVDDTSQNVTDVANAYKNNPNVKVICVNYTKMDARKNAFNSGPNASKLHAEANAQWYKIRDSLRQQLLGSLF